LRFLNVGRSRQDDARRDKDQESRAIFSPSGERRRLIMFNRILVPIDVGDPGVAREALEAALALARSFDSAVRLVHVASPIAPVAPMAAIPQRLYDNIGAAEQAELARIAGRLGLPDGKVTTAVRIGSAYPELLAEAKEWGADLIVVGAHTRSVATYLLGSTAIEIGRNAKCTVMIVRSPLRAAIL
jgi:nucleotide-binding universal stress UspA family protein